MIIHIKHVKLSLTRSSRLMAVEASPKFVLP